jgi:hypothetical protein
MRKTLPLFALLLATAACSGAKEERHQSEDLKTYDVAEPPSAEPPDGAARMSPPGIAPTAAPGVAFNYRYAFRLPARRIGDVQEQHAAACEKLGTDRCRITAMRYTLVDDDEVEAQLAFKLDPAIARAFGKQGIDAVTRAAGLLTEAEITGTDVGSDIAAGTRNEATLKEELERIEQQLARPGLSGSERAQLQQQAQELRGSIRAGQTSQTERREMLARTPVVFTYRAGDTRGPVQQALVRAGDNFVTGGTMLLVLLVSILPWALAAALGLWAVLRVRRWVLRDTPATLPGSSPPEA